MPTGPSSSHARPIRYVLVAALGVLVQATVVVAASGAGCTPVGATLLGIEAAILHNFAWHDRWTWSDRPRRERWTVRLARYNLLMAGSSLVLGAAVTWAVVAGLGWGVLPANAVAVAVAAAANYLASDRLVFLRTVRRTGSVPIRAPGVHDLH